jgi:hypothetical protein
VAALVGLFLTSAAIALAWLLYRLDRMHARHRDLDGALAVVRGVKRGMVERVDGDVGWAEHYFATVYTGDPGDPELDKRLEEAWASVVERRSPMQVFPVPLAPLQLLVSSPDLVSDETVFIANVALWRIGVFNQYVRIQEDFNARLAPEIHDPHLDEDRRKAIGHAAVWIAEQMHVYGIGRANVGGAWYARLKRALDEDIARLTADRSKGFLEYSGSRRWFLVGDLGMIALVAAFAVTVIVRAC